MDLHCAVYSSSSLPSHRRHLFHMARVGGPVLVGSLEASFHVEGSPCILEGPGNQYELPSWTCTALFTARHFSDRTGDTAVTWPESPELVGSLVVNFDIEGSPCVLKAPDDQYGSPSWTCTAPSTARHLFLRTEDTHVTWPESPILVEALVASLDVEGPLCVLEGPCDQYESTS